MTPPAAGLINGTESKWAADGDAAGAKYEMSMRDYALQERVNRIGGSPGQGPANGGRIWAWLGVR